MDPFSLSLLSLGISSMAIRRVVRAIETTELEEQAAELERRINPARKLLLHAVAEASLRSSRGNPVNPVPVAVELSAEAAYDGLYVDQNVRLDTIFEAEGEEIEDVVCILSRRYVDAMIYDAEGRPLCALCQPRRRGEPAPLVRQLFEMTGVPIACIPPEMSWQDGMASIDEAFGVADDARIHATAA